MQLVNEVFRCCARKEIPVSPQILDRTVVAQNIENVSSVSMGDAQSRSITFEDGVVIMSVGTFLRKAIDAGILLETPMSPPMSRAMPRDETAVTVAARPGKRRDSGAHAVVHKPIVNMSASQVAGKHAATSPPSVPPRNLIARVRLDGVAAAVHKSLPTPRQSKEEAAIKIQRAWRSWRERVQTDIADAPEDLQFIYTYSMALDSSRVSRTTSLADKLGTTHFVPVHGKGPVLSMYSRPFQLLGEGAFSMVFNGPRGYISRFSKKEALPATMADASQYADLESFVACTRVADCLEIGRYAGQDIHRYLSTRAGSLPLGIFKKASADLKSLHERGLFHMDIKLDNMTYLRKKNGEEMIYFIDCDRISNTPRYLPTLSRWTIRSDKHDSKDVGARADDEFSFLYSLMAVVDISFAPIYLSKKDALTAEQMKILRRNAECFVQRYILPQYRNQVLQFITLPVRQNFLSVPLHDTFDWDAHPDMISAMQYMDVSRVKSIGAAMLGSNATPAQKRDFLLAQGANSVPGIYWVTEPDAVDGMHQAWLELFWQLPVAEQIYLCKILFALPDTAGKTGWFQPSMTPCRVPASAERTGRRQ